MFRALLGLESRKKFTSYYSTQSCIWRLPYLIEINTSLPIFDSRFEPKLLFGASWRLQRFIHSRAGTNSVRNAADILPAIRYKTLNFRYKLTYTATSADRKYLIISYFYLCCPGWLVRFQGRPPPLPFQRWRFSTQIKLATVVKHSFHLAFF